jgi:dGTP triphosphohydrolase
MDLYLHKPFYKYYIYSYIYNDFNVGLYERILQVCEFVAGMTDSYAVMLYKRLQGIELPK